LKRVAFSTIKARSWGAGLGCWIKIAELPAYLLWQQLSVQPSLQQASPHFWWQQASQYIPFEKEEVWANAVTARTKTNASATMMRLMKILLRWKCVTARRR
jgi:hypothetical protein